MRKIGSSEAKAHFSELLRAVDKGETIVITRRGMPVSCLAPLAGIGHADRKAVIERMKDARERRFRVSVDEIHSARDEGRRS